MERNPSSGINKDRRTLDRRELRRVKGVVRPGSEICWEVDRFSSGGDSCNEDTVKLGGGREPSGNGLDMNARSLRRLDCNEFDDSGERVPIDGTRRRSALCEPSADLEGNLSESLLRIARPSLYPSRSLPEELEVEYLGINLELSLEIIECRLGIGDAVICVIGAFRIPRSSILVKRRISCCS